VRELRNLVDRLRIHWRIDQGALGLAQLHSWLPELLPATGGAVVADSATLHAGPAPARPSPATLHQWLIEHQGNREQLAAQLGVSRTTLWRWLRHPVDERR
jgi:propionate catabolism operon transcriptional regulator